MCALAPFSECQLVRKSGVPYMYAKAVRDAVRECVWVTLGI